MQKAGLKDITTIHQKNEPEHSNDELNSTPNPDESGKYAKFNKCYKRVWQFQVS